ncbi:MAG: radical SAM/SPASM domain-containing protein [Bacteroidota bacterium]
MNIEPTNICNLQCRICPNGEKAYDHMGIRKKGFLKHQDFKKILNQIDFPIKEINFYLHGEPLLNQQLAKMVRTAKEEQISCNIVSNGYDLNETVIQDVIKEMPREIAFSMDLIDKESYEFIRHPATYEKAFTHLMTIDRLFFAHKKKYSIKALLLNAPTPDKLMNFIEKLKKLRALRSITLSQLFPWPYKYDNNIDKDRITKGFITCPEIWSSPNVFWNGDVSLCSFDYNGDLITGNIYKNKLSEIINSSLYRSIRKNHLSGKKHYNLPCRNCLISHYQMDSYTINSAYYGAMDSLNKEYIIKEAIEKLFNHTKPKDDAKQ